MAPPITNFVDVTVNLAAPAPAAFGFGSLLGAFTHSVTANRQDGPYLSVAEMVAAGFTAAAEPEINAWGTAAFAQENNVDQVIVGRIDAGDADLTASLDAIELADPDSWYITNIEDRDDTNLGLFGTWTEARRKIGIGQSDDLTATAFLAWQAATLNRSAGIYHDDNTEYLDSAWSSKGGGFNLDQPAGQGTWDLKRLSGVPFDPVTAAQATAIWAADANLFGRTRNINFTSNGTMASGRFIDVQVTMDWLAQRLEEAIIQVLTATPTNIPYTNAGINVVAGAAQEVLSNGVVFGHFASADDSVAGGKPETQVQNVLNISAAIKATRVFTFTATATIAGAIHKVELTVNLTP